MIPAARLQRRIAAVAAAHPWGADAIAFAERWRFGEFARVPRRWKRRLVAEFVDRLYVGRAQWRADSVTAFNETHQAAIDYLAGLLGRMQMAAMSLPLDASDRDIVDEAEGAAAQLRALATIRAEPRELTRGRLAQVCRQRGIEPPCDEVRSASYVRTDPAIARMTCRLWWRRRLRRLHVRAVEEAARALGCVSAQDDVYCSNEIAARRRQQLQRNAEILAAVQVQNGDGKRYTLAELAARSPGDRQIRAAELMVRLRGFEECADAAGHVGVFVTVTCPSRMHPMRTDSRRRRVVEKNPRFDGTTAREAAAYLAGLWRRVRAKLGRDELGIYGFRIAEPQHDGTPHWHLMLFCEQARAAELGAVLSRYALLDSPNEPGAAEHRCKVVPIDKERGSAVSYCAKYIAKNITGSKLETDLFGDPVLTPEARVDAWASAHGIRQFQQIGGPPVGVWRELRRIPGEVNGFPNQALVDAPDAMRAAWLAVQRFTVPDWATGELVTIRGGEGAGAYDSGANWRAYIDANGGPICKRARRPLRLAQWPSELASRYGDGQAMRPIGVAAAGDRSILADLGELAGSFRAVLVESVRHTWQVVGRRLTEKAKRAAQTWTRVINCTVDNSAAAWPERAAPPEEPAAAALAASIESAGFKKSGTGESARTALAELRDGCASTAEGWLTGGALDGWEKENGEFRMRWHWPMGSARSGLENSGDSPLMMLRGAIEVDPDAAALAADYARSVARWGAL